MSRFTCYSDLSKILGGEIIPIITARLYIKITRYDKNLSHAHVNLNRSWASFHNILLNL